MVKTVFAMHLTKKHPKFCLRGTDPWRKIQIFYWLLSALSLANPPYLLFLKWLVYYKLKYASGWQMECVQALIFFWPGSPLVDNLLNENSGNLCTMVVDWDVMQKLLRCCCSSTTACSCCTAALSEFKIWLWSLNCLEAVMPIS